MGTFYNLPMVERQLLAMGMSHFDIAVRRSNGVISALHDDLLLAQVKDLCSWLHDQNGKRHEILVRPHGEHGMTLLSALNHEQVKTFRVAGFTPALLVAYGRDRYQMWLKHDRKLPKEASERAARYLAERSGADLGNAHWDSFGYLAGFALPVAPGEIPIQVLLAESSGAVYPQAAEIGGRFAPHQLE